jgi:hypothetical protein
MEAWLLSDEEGNEVFTTTAISGADGPAFNDSDFPGAPALLDFGGLDGLLFFIRAQSQRRQQPALVCAAF